MEERRLPPNLTTPVYEDSGIFKSHVGQFLVDLVPRQGRNSRNDLVVKAYLDQRHAIDVVFAGRRAKKAQALIRLLETRWNAANKLAETTGEPPEADDVRLGVRVEGAWRPRFQRDDMGWQTHHYQLFAARWSYLDDAGRPVSFGEPPVR